MREIQERIQQLQEDEKARIPIANPLPWTTEFPEVKRFPEYLCIAEEFQNNDGIAIHL
jgi:hypothetical protein